MKCTLSKIAVGEHSSIKDKRYAETFLNCPLFDGKQICLWCCLHISDMAEPLNRGDRMEKHPEYADSIADECSRQWDEIWSICNKCAHG